VPAALQTKDTVIHVKTDTKLHAADTWLPASIIDKQHLDAAIASSHPHHTTPSKHDNHSISLCSCTLNKQRHSHAAMCC
jgi:hypothetical protein